MRRSNSFDSLDITVQNLSRVSVLSRVRFEALHIHDEPRLSVPSQRTVNKPFSTPK